MIANYNTDALENMQIRLKSNVYQNIGDSVRHTKVAIKAIEDVLTTKKTMLESLRTTLESTLLALEKERKRIMHKVGNIEKEITIHEKVKNEIPDPSKQPSTDFEKQTQEAVEKVAELYSARNRLFQKIQMLEAAYTQCKAVKLQCDDKISQITTYLSDTSSAVEKLEIIFRQLTEKVDGLCVKLDEAKTKIYEYGGIYPNIAGQQFRQRKRSKTGYFDTDKVQDYKRSISKIASELEKTIKDMITYHKSYKNWEDINFEKTQIVLEHTGMIISSMKDSLSDNTKVLTEQGNKIEQYLSYSKKIK